jgi:hypothetical protein
MRSLLRLLVTVLLLGTAMQQGWLQAAIGFVTEHLGGPAATMEPLPRIDVTGLFGRLGDAVATLPDPWYSLALMICGIIALIFAASVINGLVRATLRLTGWLRDAFV